ncbi:MAG TPA: response regulator transcription factor [Anaerolineales bacterium]|nr:response regulator transcription factor [Anaerolineales bacterium]
MKPSAAGATPRINKWDDEGREAVRVIVVAPALAWRAGIRALLSADDRLQVIGEAASPSELDLAPPGARILVMAGSDVFLQELGVAVRTMQPVSVLLLVEDDPGAARALINLPVHAWGILSLDASAEELSAAVHALAEGLLVGSPGLLSSLLAGAPVELSGEDEPLIEALTEREAEVLQFLAQGLANKQIAAALGISEHTVKFHASAIFAKLGASSRTEAVRIGIRRGLVML